jgi:plastocyanin
LLISIVVGRTTILVSFAALFVFPTIGAVQSPRQDVQQVTLVATDYAFSPSVLHAMVDRPLEIALVNRSTTKTHGLRLVLSYGEVPFPENVPPGRTITAVFDNLGHPGTYRFYCPVDDHEQHGMEGTLVVASGKDRSRAAHARRTVISGHTRIAAQPGR